MVSMFIALRQIHQPSRPTAKLLYVVTKQLDFIEIKGWHLELSAHTHTHTHFHFSVPSLAMSRSFSLFCFHSLSHPHSNTLHSDRQGGLEGTSSSVVLCRLPVNVLHRQFFLLFPSRPSLSGRRFFYIFLFPNKHMLQRPLLIISKDIVHYWSKREILSDTPSLQFS